MKRREFITALGGAATWPLAARAQQTSLPRIGWLGATEPNARLLSVFLQTLAEADYIEGRNVAIEYRYAEGRYDRMPAMATELVRQQVALIVASPTPAALAAKGGTATVPIVFGVTDDPVKLGLVTSLGRPGETQPGCTFSCPIWRRNNSDSYGSLLRSRAASVCSSIPTMPTSRH